MVKEFLFETNKVYDPIHGFIEYDALEKRLIDSLPFQRLHYIRQLGIAFLVYPGATHTRFEHSLGTMALATRMYRVICKNVRPDLFGLVPRKGSLEYRYWLKVLRLAALCHDLGHLPFSHCSEKPLLGKNGHEYWTLKVMESPYIAPILVELIHEIGFEEVTSEDKILYDVIKLALGPEKLKIIAPERKFSFSSWEKILAEIITGDFFGADRIDYLLRDARSTAVTYGLFDYEQLIESLRILPVSNKQADTALGIDENGIESCESLLLARHFMHKRVYQHSVVKAYAFHLSRFMQAIYNKGEHFTSLDEYLHERDVEVLYALQKAADNPQAVGYRDALSLERKKRRMKALPVSKGFAEKDLDRFRKDNNISVEEIFLETEFSSEKEDFNFPVAKRYLDIVQAKECSTLLSQAFHGDLCWVYLPAELEMPFLRWLKK